MKPEHTLWPIRAWMLSGTALVMLGSCSTTSPPPQPARPPSVVAATPVAKPAPLVPRGDWRDQPQTPGSWRWAQEGTRSVARFADSLVVLVCDRAAGEVTLFRRGSATGPVPASIATTAESRSLSGRPADGAVAISLAARDPLLDAMAISRGRFAVEVSGLDPLYLPSWPEVSRVIEDCR